MTWLRRAIIRLHIRRRTQQPQVYRFHADRWHSYRIWVAAGQMNLQVCDSVPLLYVNQPTLVIVKSDVEGVQWWKVDSAVPAVDLAPVPPVRALRPFEVTDDVQWSQNSKPAVVISNPKTHDAKVEIFYAVRDEDVGGGGGDL